MASDRAGELLAELQTERDLKLKAEERSTTLQEKANQDAVVIDRAIQERNEAHREAEARRADLGVEVARWRGSFCRSTRRSCQGAGASLG